MKIISLELTNYRKFKTALIEFPEGVIGILGLNGAGKSTIIEAIAWVLFGNEQTIVRTKKEHLKHFGATPNEVCEVKLEFELDGDKYLVTRSMKGKNYQTTAEMTVNGTSMATSTKGVTSFVEDRLGMDYQAFYTSVFAKQKELNALSTLDTSKRKRLILRMLNIDSIEKAVITLRRDIRDIKTRLDENRKTLIEPDGTPKIETSKAKIKEHEAQLDEVSQNIKVLESGKGELDKDLKGLENTRKEMRIKKDEFNKLANQLIGLETNISNTSSQITKLESELKILNQQRDELQKIEPKKVEWLKIKTKKDSMEEARVKFIRGSELNEQKKKVEKVIETNTSELKKLQEKIKKFDGLPTEIESCQKKLQDVRTEIDDKKKNQTEWKTNIENLEVEIHKFNAKLKDIQKLGPDSKCPTCERVLEEQFRFLEDKFSFEIGNLTDKRDELLKNLDEGATTLEDAKRRFEALNKKEKFLTGEEKEHARLEANIKAVRTELEKNQKQKQEIEGELNGYESLEFNLEDYEKLKKKYGELEEINEKIITLTNNVNILPKKDDEYKKMVKSQQKFESEKVTLEKKSRALGFDETKLVEVEIKFDAQSKKLKEHELLLKEKEHELKLHEKDIKVLENKIEVLKEQEQKAEDYKKELVYLNKLDSVLNKFKSYMINRISPTLTQYASDLFMELTDGRYNRMEVDEDYNVVIYDQGEMFPLDRFSGGEEDLANLCLRLAISQVITAQSGTTGPQFVILDEVFGSQDTHRKRNLLQALGKLTNKFRQIFLITHIEEVKEFIENNIMVMDNNDGTSSATSFI